MIAIVPLDCLTPQGYACAMKKLLWIALTLCATSLWGQDVPIAVLPDYEVVGILQIGEQPAEVTLRSAEGQTLRRKVGGQAGAFTLEAVILLGQEQFVRARHGEQVGLFALKRSNGLPFHDGPLADSYAEGLIDAQGKLTTAGREKIDDHLKDILRAGYAYCKANPVNEVNYGALVGPEFSARQAIAGEDYSPIVFQWKMGLRSMEVTTVFGESVSLMYDISPDAKPLLR